MSYQLTTMDRMKHVSEWLASCIVGNQPSSSAEITTWPAPKPGWKPCPVAPASKRVLTTQVEVQTFDTRTGLPVMISDDSSNTTTLGDHIPRCPCQRDGQGQGHGEGQGQGQAPGQAKVTGALRPSNSNIHDWALDIPQAYGRHSPPASPLDISGSKAVHFVHDEEDDDEEYDYGDRAGVTYSRDPKRSPASRTSKPLVSRQSSILSKPPRKSTCGGGQCRVASEQQQQTTPLASTSSSSTTTRGASLEQTIEGMSAPPPTAVQKTRRPTLKRPICHLDPTCTATAMLADIGEIEGLIFKENLRILEEDGCEEPIDITTICCKTLRRRGIKPESSRSDNRI
ncbi:hypothetical protein V8F20_010659 [Naviculisporaceae sp. PSN 640]